MESLLWFSVIVVAVAAIPANFPIKKEYCSPDFHEQHEAVVEASRCGEPKPTLVTLPSPSLKESVFPSAVFVNRCVGLCTGYGDSSCEPLSTVTIKMPARVYNAATNKNSCVYFSVEEHVTCGCAAKCQNSDCQSPRVFNPRKCSCTCPNKDERRHCKKQIHMKWNAFKCICEERRKRR